MRNVCVVLTARASYARVKALIAELASRPGIELTVLLHSSACLPKYGGDFATDLIELGVPAGRLRGVMNVIEGGTPGAMVRTAALAAMDLATDLERHQPDVVVTVADRAETLATAMAASYLNIPLAHIQGGEQTGSIDDKVRDAVSMLSDMHFPATGKSAARLMAMGLDDVFATGCPSIDLVAKVPREFPPLDQYTGVGPELDTVEPYVVVLQHPVTTCWQSAHDHMRETLAALTMAYTQVVLLWPNIDAGTDGTSKAIREFRESDPHFPMHCYRNMTPEHFAQLLMHATCLIGNSSVGIRECAYLGVPVVNIGDRQQGRERASNVLDVPHEADAILSAIKAQAGQRFKPSTLYGDGHASRAIAEILAHA